MLMHLYNNNIVIINYAIKNVDSGLAVFRVGGCSIKVSIKVKDCSARINHPSIKVRDCLKEWVTVLLEYIDLFNIFMLALF